jgi:hypothetical protein
MNDEGDPSLATVNRCATEKKLLLLSGRMGARPARAEPEVVPSGRHGCQK